MIQTKSFGRTSKGEEVLCFTLKNEFGEVEILNYGATVRSIKVPSSLGKLTDVALGYNNIEDYEKNEGYLGAVIGRYGNRIWKGKFNIGEEHYNLFLNDGDKSLHGGKEGFDKKIWTHTINDDVLSLKYFSPDMEEGYPGNLSVEVQYSFEYDSLKIEYFAQTDKKTIINLTNHSYFNLAGEGSGNILGHDLTIYADEYLPTDEESIPLGIYAPVEDTPFDFRNGKTIGQDIDSDYDQIQIGKGYDHSYVLNNEGQIKLFSKAYCPETGIAMDSYTDQVGFQFYSGNFLDMEGKNGYYNGRSAFCLETQHFPDSPNHPSFPSTVLDAGEKYHYTTIYKFYNH